MILNFKVGFTGRQLSTSAMDFTTYHMPSIKIIKNQSCTFYCPFSNLRLSLLQGINEFDKAN